MRKPDDCSLTVQEQLRIRREARRALLKADALGTLPTPVAEVMAAAHIREIADDVLDESFVRKLRRRAGAALKRALGKVIGVFDAHESLVIVSRTLVKVKQTFIRLHETGHGFLPWQRSLYAAVEDDEDSIAPEIADLFDREANCFASEVLFQLDAFNEEAAQSSFGILVPVKLSRRYGSSIYAAVRRYVSHNDGACAVLVLDPPILCDGDGFRCNLRRVIVSQQFADLFGSISWPEFFTPRHELGAMVPVGGRRMSGKRSVGLKDRNGGRHECVAEAFTQTHQIFILLHASEALRPTLIQAGGGAWRKSVNASARRKVEEL